MIKFQSLKSGSPAGKSKLKKWLKSKEWLSFPFTNRFADLDSFRAYYRSYSGLKNEFGILPALVVNGPIGCGKSSLVRMYVLGKYSEEARFFSWPKTQREMKALLDVAAAHSWKYLWFDDVSAMKDSSTYLLQAFACAKMWGVQKFNRREMDCYGICTEIIISGPDLAIPSGLFRRCRFVNLKPETTEIITEHGCELETQTQPA
jgi:hypothetical protein